MLWGAAPGRPAVVLLRARGATCETSLLFMPEAKQAEGARFLLSVQQLGFSLLEFSLLQITRCNVHTLSSHASDEQSHVYTHKDQAALTRSARATAASLACSYANALNVDIAALACSRVDTLHHRNHSHDRPVANATEST